MLIRGAYWLWCSTAVWLLIIPYISEVKPKFCLFELNIIIGNLPNLFDGLGKHPNETIHPIRTWLVWWSAAKSSLV